MATHRLPILDGLRGIAAVMVMLYHAEVTFGILGPFSRGYLFVDFFFLLSGFVLTLSAEHKLKGRGASARFLLARMRRLWPLSAVGTLVGVSAALFTGRQEGAALSMLLGLLMVPSFAGSGPLFPLNGPQWSLFLELVANALHAVVLRRIDGRELRLLVVASALALMLTTMIFGSNNLGPFAMSWFLALPRVVFSYTSGVWIARRWARERPAPVLSWQLALGLPVACVVLLSILPLSVVVGDILVTVVLLPVLFWVAACAPVPPGAEPWLRRLGAVSFPLYAVHVPILDAVAYINRDLAPMLFAVVASVLAALLVERLSAVLLMKSTTVPCRAALAT